LRPGAVQPEPDMAPGQAARYSMVMGSLNRSIAGAIALACILVLTGGALSAQEGTSTGALAPQTAAPAASAPPAVPAEAPAATGTTADAAIPTGAPAAARKGFGAWLASPSAYRPELGLIFIANLDPESGIATTHLITDSFGFALEYGLGSKGLFGFEPGLTLYGNYYTLSAAGKAVPCGAELRDVYMIGALLDLPFLLELRLGPRFHMSAGAGLTLHLRVGIKAAPDIGIQGDTSDDDAVLQTINLYYWSMGRFFLPSTILRFEYAAKEKLSFGLAFKAYWPIFNLWAGEDLGFFDQMILGVALTARFAR